MNQEKRTNRKTYKTQNTRNNNLLRDVSMIPGYRKVAGCFNISNNLGELSNGRHFNIC